MIANGDHGALAASLVRRGHRVVFVAGVRLGTTSQTHLIKVEPVA